MKRLTCMTKRLFYALLFVMMIWMPSYVQAAGETKTLQDTNPGDEITFAGQQWIVLEPEEGYIFAKEAIGSRAFDPESNQFDPTSSENIGYYLNVDYWGSLSLAEQRVIQDREWTLDDFDVQYAPVVAKVGLLSFFEWGKYREDDVIANPSAPMWLRTPTGSDSFVVITHPNGSNQGLIVSYPVDVLPALALETALLLSETNEVLLPEVSFAPNGMENWEKKHTTEIEVSDIYNQIEQLQYQWSTSIETPAESGWSDFANRDTISTPAGAVGEHYLHVRGIDADKQVVMSDVSEVFKLVQQIEDMNQGAEINFAGRGWIVLEPEEGYIFAKESLGMIPFAPTDTAKFDPMERNSLAHYLNTEYYEGLTAGEQAVIQNTIWDIADFYPPVTAKIGLLSEAEWNKYGNRSGSRVISRTPLGDMWLRTSSSPWLQAYVSSWHGGIMPGIPDTPQAVYPTLTLPPNLYIADSQEVFFTEVDFTSNGNSKWAPQHTTEVTVHNDLTEVFDIQYAWSTNTTKPEDGWKSLDSDSDSIQTPTDISGVFYLHVQGQETLGGTFHRVSKAFHVDDIEPELSVEMLAGDELYEDDTWINQEVTVSIEAIDENIEILVITQNGEEITDIEGFQHHLDFTASGTYQLEITAADKADNQTNVIRTIHIDQDPPDPPTIELDPSDWTNKDNVIVTISDGADQESGVDRTEYRIEENDWESYEEAFEITKEGETLIEARTIDQAGNVSDTAQSIVKIDRVAPDAPVITLDPSGWTNKEEVLVTITSGEDQGSGVALIEYRIAEEKDWKTYQEAFSMAEEGETGIYARVVDQIGNVSDVVQETVKIDHTAPEITLNGETEITIELGGSYEEVGATAQDNFDGDVSNRIKITGSVNTSKIGTYQLTYTVKDSAGNNTSIPRTVHVEDTTVPTDISIEAAEVTTDSVMFTFAAKDLGGIREYILSRDGEEIARVDGSGTTYTDEKVQAGTTYLYELTAIDFSDNAAAVEIEITTEQKPAPGAPVTVEYVDEAGNSLAEAEELIGNIGEIYQTAAKKIEGYQLMKEPDNADGKYTEKAQTVTYVYAPGKEDQAPGARVTVKHVDEEGTELLPVEELTGNKGDFYQTFPAHIAGYEVIQIPDNTAGEFTNEAQTVIYVYALVEGESEGTIIIEYVDEAGNSIAGRESQTGPVGEIYETKPKTIAGYQLVQTPDNAAGKFTEEIQLVKYVYALDKVPMPGAAVTVKHVEEKGNELIPAEELTGNLGDFYQTYPATIDGYKVVLTPENAAGKFTDETQTVKYVYAPVEKKPEGALIIEYVDEAGNSVAGKESRSGPVGEIYKTEPKAIKGYRLIQEPDNATGEFMKEVQTITYVYAPVKKELKPGAPVTVNYVDEEGKELIPSEELTGNLGDSYQTIGKRMEGYQLIQIPDNAIGKFTEKAQSVTYVYVPEKSAELNEPETIEIILDQPPVEVFPGITVFIKGTQTIIQLPADLPMGTLLQVHSIEAEQQDGLEQAGEVYDFLFTYPESDEGYMGDFILTMGVDGDSEQAAIYHYQKGSEKWEWIGGTIDARTITANVSHFSAYGVFEAEKGLEEEPAPRKEKEKAEEEEKGSSSKNQSGVAAQGVTQAGNPNGMGETASQLPSTAANQYIWLLAGVLLIVLGSGFVSIRKKRKQM